MNDYVVMEKKGNYNERFFQIKYCDIKKAYLLKDLDYGTGTFIKILHKLVLRNISMISFGDSHFNVNVILQSNSASTKTKYLLQKPRNIVINFVSGPKQGEK